MTLYCGVAFLFLRPLNSYIIGQTDCQRIENMIFCFVAKLFYLWVDEDKFIKSIDE